MKKRLVCLLLAAVMLMSVLFTGCSQDDSTSADIDTKIGAKTITMRIVTERKVFNTDAELEKYLTDVCGGNEKDERYIEHKRIKEVYDAVEAAFSKETKTQKINVDLIFYTEEEYFTMLEDTMAEYALEQLEAGLAKRALEFYMDEYKAAYPEQYSDAQIAQSFYHYFPEYKRFENYDSKNQSAGERYEIGDFGIPQLVYPDAEENQLDIVYIQGEDMYKQYIENGWIVSLDEYLGSTGSLLNDYISTTLMNGVKVDGSTFAIPNNVRMGEYTYMFIDKELADKYKYTYESFKDITDCEYFLEDIKNSESGVLPIASSFKECMDLFVWYWNIDVEEGDLGTVYTPNTENKPSVLGQVYGDPADIGRGKIELGFNNLFADERYIDILKTLKSYEYGGMFEQANDKRKDGTAISFQTGTYAVKKQAFFDENGNEKKPSDLSYGVYTDENGKSYYVYVAKYPQAEKTSLYGNMFAISANSKNPEACMKVLTLLNTNAKLKNLLQYGIEGVNYIINEDTGMLERLNRDYLMDTERTGNCFISHPEEGLPADYWEDAKRQSNETLINPLLGFDFNVRLAEYGSQLDLTQISVWQACNEETFAKLEASNASSYDAFLVELDSVIKATDRELVLVSSMGMNLLMTKMTNKDYSTFDEETGEQDLNGESPYTIYYKWLKEMKYLPDVVN